MKFFKETYSLTANVWQRIDVGGLQFLLLQGNDLDVRVRQRQSVKGTLLSVPQGIAIPVREGFDGVEIRSATNTTAVVIIVDDDIDLQAIAQNVVVTSLPPAPAALNSGGVNSLAPGNGKTFSPTSGRREFGIHAHPDNTTRMEVRDKNQDTIVFLQPGETAIFVTEDRLILYNTSGATVQYTKWETIS